MAAEIVSSHYLGVAFAIPVSPLANFLALLVLPFCGQLAVVMIVAPMSVLSAVLIGAHGSHCAIPMVRTEQTVPNPPQTIGRLISAISEVDCRGVFKRHFRYV